MNIKRIALLVGLVGSLVVLAHSGPQEPDPSPAERPAGPPLATLRVIVINEDGEPVPEVYLNTSTTETEKTVLGTLGFDAKEALQGKTDHEGLRTVHLLAGKDRTLNVGPFPGTSTETVEVPALEPDEVREVRVPVLTRPDATFVGRLLDAATGAPAVGVRVQMEATKGMSMSDRIRRLRLDKPSVANTGEDGMFEVPFHTWCDDYATFYAPGRHLQRVHLEKPEEGETYECSLRRSSVIEGVIEGMYSDDARLEASFGIRDLAFPAVVRGGSWNDVGLYGEIEADGGFRLVDIPSKVRVRLRMMLGREILREWPDEIRLKPGEALSLNWPAPREPALRGTVTDSEGKPVRDQYLYLFKAGVQGGKLLNTYVQPWRYAQTDSKGIYTFDELGAGDWTVGLAPRNRAPKGARRARDLEFAPIARSITTIEGETAVLDFVADAGLYITGRVLDPTGQGVDSSVSATSPVGRVSGLTEPDGSFRLGPVPAGTFELVATALERSLLAPSASVLAEPGAASLTLELEPGAAIQVRFVESTGGNALAAEAYLSGTGQPRSTSRSRGSNVYAFSNLTPGVYHLAGVTEDGRVGVQRNLEMQSGPEVREVEILVGPAAVIVVEHSGPEPRSVLRLTSGDLALGWQVSSQSEDARFLTPGGPVQIHRGEEVLELDVKVGEEVRVAFDKEDDK